MTVYVTKYLQIKPSMCVLNGKTLEVPQAWSKVIRSRKLGRKTNLVIPLKNINKNNLKNICTRNIVFAGGVNNIEVVNYHNLYQEQDVHRGKDQTMNVKILLNNTAIANRGARIKTQQKKISKKYL